MAADVERAFVQPRGHRVVGVQRAVQPSIERLVDEREQGARFDAALLQEDHQRIARDRLVLHDNREEHIPVLGAGPRVRELQRSLEIAQALEEGVGGALPDGHRRLALLEFGEAERRLELGAPEAVPQPHEGKPPARDGLQFLPLGPQVVVYPRVDGIAPVVHQAPQQRQDVVVVGHAEPADAGVDDVGDVGGKAGDVAERPDRPAAHGDEHRFRGVLHDAQAAGARDSADRRQVARQAADVHRHNRPRARGQMLFNPGRVDAEIVGFDVDEHGRQPVMERDVRSRHEGEGRHQHLVAILPVVDFLERGKRDVQGAGAAVAHQTVPAPVQAGQLLFEPLHHGTGRQPSAVQHLHDEVACAVADPAAAYADLGGGGRAIQRCTCCVPRGMHEAAGYHEGLLPMLWRCPFCRDPLAGDAEELTCASCRRPYPVLGGIPDLRIPGTSWVDHDADRAAARRLLDRSREGTAEELIRAVFGARAGWTSSRVDARTRDVLAAPDHLRPQLAGWLRGAAAGHGMLLEVGCGPGMLLAAMAGSGRPAAGVDVSLVWLVVAQRLIGERGGIPVLAAAMGEALPIADASVGAIVSLDVIEHVGAPDRYLEALDRALAPGGFLALSTPNRFSLAAEPHVGVWGVGWLPRRWQAAYVRWRSGQPYESVALLSARELRRALARHTVCRCEIVAPPVPDYAVANFPPYRRRLARLYNRLNGSAIGRRLFVLIGPFLRAVGTKTGASTTSSRRTSGRAADRDSRT